jgi:hypothetical protein
MKKTIFAALVLLAAAGAFAEAEEPQQWGGIFYAAAGYQVNSVTYTGTDKVAAAIDASGLVLEAGVSARWVPIPLLALDATLGTVLYGGVGGAVTAMGSRMASDSANPYTYVQTYVDSEDYTGGDDESFFAAAALSLCLPFLPVNLYAGWRHSWFFADLVTTMVGSDSAFFGLEVLVTRSVSVKLGGELPFLFGPTYTLFDGATVSPGSGYLFTAQAIYRFDSWE